MTGTEVTADNAARLALELATTKAANKKLRAALVEITGAGCSNYIKPFNCAGAGRDRSSPYGAENWCDQCIAGAALAGES